MSQHPIHARRQGRVTAVDLWYPGLPPEHDSGNVDAIEITLVHVRAARSIRIEYDFDRDGYRILGERNTGADEPYAEAPAPDETWQEEAFIPAWMDPASPRIGDPWADFMDARLRLIHRWHSEGIPGSGRNSPAAIAAHLNRHDPGQIELLLQTAMEPPIPGCTRYLLRRMSTPTAAGAGPQSCSKAPPGWFCSRSPGHDGPCAAWRLEQASIDGPTAVTETAPDGGPQETFPTDRTAGDPDKAR
jgi:hypothetical protein